MISAHIEFMEEKLGGPFEANKVVYTSISNMLIDEGLALPDRYIFDLRQEVYVFAGVWRLSVCLCAT